MNTWSISMLFSSTKSRPRDIQHAPLGRRAFSFRASFLLVPLLLAGCIDRAVSSDMARAVQAVLPDSKVMDYRTAQCETIWYIGSNDALENGLYWLRTMDCADRLGASQARALAKTLATDSWSGVFKQGILLGSAEPSAAERRQIIERLNRVRMEFPGSLRPLLQMWREQQVLQVALMEEKNRFQRLQDITDTQIDALRESHSRLQYRLEETTRKLENLTDIERQLSSRKQLQGDISGSDGDTPRKSMTAEQPAVKPAPVNEPEKTEAPAKPVTQPKTEVPAKPVQPETPAKPAEPPKAETPVESTEPAKTEAPVKPTESSKAEAPVKAAEPPKAESTEPKQAEAPAKPVAPQSVAEVPKAAEEQAPAASDTPEAATEPQAPAATKESKPHDTTQTSQPTAG